MKKSTKKAKVISALDAYAALRAKAEWPTEADVDYAQSVLRASYYQGVTRRAESFYDELRHAALNDEKHGRSEEAFREYFEQQIDGDHDVIYTRCVSDYTDTALDELDGMGLEHPTPEQIAYECLRVEVWEALEQELECTVGEWFEKRKAS